MTVTMTAAAVAAVHARSALRRAPRACGCDTKRAPLPMNHLLHSAPLRLRQRALGTAAAAAAAAAEGW
jgi:hypothetical protein